MGSGTSPATPTARGRGRPPRPGGGGPPGGGPRPPPPPHRPQGAGGDLQLRRPESADGGELRRWQRHDACLRRGGPPPPGGGLGAGRRTQRAAPNQASVVYGYDAASRVRTISQAPLGPVTLDYDALGRRTRLSLPNGVSTEPQYDAASRLTALLYRTAAGQLGDLTYQYDPAGNRTRVGGAFSRTLVPTAVPAASYDGANRQLGFGSQLLTYDPNGNLTSDGVNLYTWNARNQLLAITGPGMTATFSYDALGRRQGRSVNGASTQFLYDGLTPIQEAGPTGLATLLTGVGIDEYPTRTDSTGPPQHFL